MRYPENLNHPNQKYRLSDKGDMLRKELIKTINEGAKQIIEGVNEGVKLEIELLYHLIVKHPGKKASEFNEQIEKSVASTE